MNIDGSGFEVLHRFSTFVNPANTNADGSAPMAGVVLSGDTLYGTAGEGGGHACGTVFKVSTDGRDFAILHDFAGPDGARPVAGLVLSGNTLYGITQRGGHNGGVIFKVNTDGSGFAVLHSMSKMQGEHSPTNSDGAYSQADLVLSGQALYGTGWWDGPGGVGTIFKINTDGKDFKVLHSFAKGKYYDVSGRSTGHMCNHEGAALETSLVVIGKCLFGTASEGGEAAHGTVFKMNTDGSDFAVVHCFSEMTQDYTNGDGAAPKHLMLSGQKFYGFTAEGGPRRVGTLFSFIADGSEFAARPGAYAVGAEGTLILFGNEFYGTTSYGGGKGGGTVFKVRVDGTGFAALHGFTRDPLPPGLSD